MRLFLFGLLLMNVAYFFVPEKLGMAQESSVERGDRRVKLLVRLGEDDSQLSVHDDVARALDSKAIGDAREEVVDPVGQAESTQTAESDDPVQEELPGSTPQESALGKRCFTVGPFRRETKAELMTSQLQKSGMAVEWRASKERRTRGYSVFLPSYPSYEAAEAVVKKLSEQGVNDYYILTDADRRNAISLGFFTLKSGSEKRVARLRSMGYRPQVEVRFDEIPVYWLDYEAASEQDSRAFWEENPPADNVELLPRACK